MSEHNPGEPDFGPGGHRPRPPSAEPRDTPEVHDLAADEEDEGGDAETAEDVAERAEGHS